MRLLRDSDFELLSDFALRISDFKPVTIGSTVQIEAPKLSCPPTGRSVIIPTIKVFFEWGANKLQTRPRQ